MLAKKNENIKKVYDIQQLILQDENERMAYEAREAEIKDEMIRIKSAEERGKRKGRLEDKVETATKLLKLGVSIDIIIKAMGLSEEKVIQIKKGLES